MVEISPLISRRSRISASAFTGRPSPTVAELDPQSKLLLNTNSVQLGLVSRQVETLSARVNQLSSSLESVRVNLASSQALERQKERQEQILETKLAQQKLREGKESVIEKRITAATLKPAIVLGNKARGSLLSLNSIFTGLFGAFLAFKGIETLQALSEGNTEKLNEIKNQILVTVGGFIGLNLAIKAATGTLSMGFLKIAGGLGLLSAAVIFREPITNFLDDVRARIDGRKPLLEPGPDPDQIPEPGATQQEPQQQNNQSQQQNNQSQQQNNQSQQQSNNSQGQNITRSSENADAEFTYPDGSTIKPGDLVGPNPDEIPAPGDTLNGKGGTEVEPQTPTFDYDWYKYSVDSTPSSMMNRKSEEEKIKTRSKTDVEEENDTSNIEGTNQNNGDNLIPDEVESKKEEQERLDKHLEKYYNIKPGTYKPQSSLLPTSREQQFRQQTANREALPENQVGAKVTDPEILAMIEQENQIAKTGRLPTNIEPIFDRDKVAQTVSQTVDNQSINVIPMPVPTDNGGNPDVDVTQGAIGAGPGISIASSNPDNPYILGALAQYNVLT